MKKYEIFGCASALFVLAAAGCAPDAADEAEPVSTVEEAAAPAVVTAGAEQADKPATPAPPAGQAAAPRKLTPPVRGEAAMAYVRPTVKAAKIKGRDFIVTTIQVKNVSTGSIAGLKVDEFWYDKTGAIVTGDNYRHPRPIQPDEVVTVTLETPRTANMDSNQIKFEHANGTVKVTLVPKL